MKLTLVLLFACLALDCGYAAPQYGDPEDEEPVEEVEEYPEPGDKEGIFQKSMEIMFHNFRVIGEEGLSILKERPSNFDEAFEIAVQKLKKEAEKILEILSNQEQGDEDQGNDNNFAMQGYAALALPYYFGPPVPFNQMRTQN